ncbi:hypothetical protein BJ138DRAFT_1016948, partial [Hygrophoropsis aurantiaca]
RMLSSCPPCQYRTEDEPPLAFSVLCALDGNNSAKLADPVLRGGTKHPDPRDGTSPIWLSESYVDQFKDEVSRAHNAAPLADDPIECGPDDPWVDEPSMEGDDAEPVAVCIDRWHNAAPEARKKMFAIFKKLGIFITVCHHGMLLTICDMV